jgi:hypothetical protein
MSHGFSDVTQTHAHQLNGIGAVDDFVYTSWVIKEWANTRPVIALSVDKHALSMFKLKQVEFILSLGYSRIHTF